MKPARHPARNGDLAAIHIAKARLGLPEDEYRDLMATVCGGIRSAAQLDITGRRRFLAHLQACLRQQQPERPQAVIRGALTPQQRLMWSLWMRLADAGLVNERSMSALQAWTARQTGVDQIVWLNPQQQQLVLASLKGWLKSRQEPQEPARAA